MKTILSVSVLVCSLLSSTVALAGDWNCFGVLIRNDRVVDGGGLIVVGTWPSPNNPGSELVMLGYSKAKNARVVAIRDCFPATEKAD